MGAVTNWWTEAVSTRFLCSFSCFCSLWIDTGPICTSKLVLFGFFLKPTGQCGCGFHKQYLTVSHPKAGKAAGRVNWGTKPSLLPSAPCVFCCMKWRSSVALCSALWWSQSSRVSIWGGMQELSALPALVNWCCVECSGRQAGDWSTGVEEEGMSLWCSECCEPAQWGSKERVCLQSQVFLQLFSKCSFDLLPTKRFVD